MPTNADVVSLQVEKVRKQLPTLFEASNWLFTEISKGEVEKVSTRDFRVPFIYSLGGNYRKFDPDGGDMGRGTGPKATHFVATYFPTTFAIELSNLQMYATAESEQATKKAFALAFSNGIKNYQFFEDCGLHQGGDGVIAAATSQATVSSKTVYTLDTLFGAQLLRRQMKVAIYDTTLGTYRTTDTVLSVDVAQGKVTMNTTITGAANTDKLAFEGVTATPPVWKHGIYEFLSTATTGTLLSVDRATYPEIISNWVNANSSALSGTHIMLLLDQIEQRRDEIGDLTAVFHMKQRTAWYKTVMALSEWQRSGKGGETPLDVVPKRAREFQFGGIRAVTDKHQNRTRIDVLNFSRFGRAELKPLDWYQVGNDRIFPIYGTSGGLAAGILMYLEYHADWYTDDPGAHGFIYSLAIPTA